MFVCYDQPWLFWNGCPQRRGSAWWWPPSSTLSPARCVSSSPRAIWKSCRL